MGLPWGLSESFPYEACTTQNSVDLQAWFMQEQCMALNLCCWAEEFYLSRYQLLFLLKRVNYELDAGQFLLENYQSDLVSPRTSDPKP